MQSIDSLRELNAKLLAEIVKFRKENTEIFELKKKSLRFAEYMCFIENTSSIEVIPKISTASIPSNQYDNINTLPSSVSRQKSLKNREMNAFLELEYKRKISNEIK
ncbi:hypothetical protein C1645_830155 [Glomus cerebriforme]|uniref:Uncharacterized protein n=1 Tax=Glomus cerebriforme TaxID=658196 RepID=A0A397SMN7_9GLOM|nr:hypothetical protein C1645_830155 [Glomus cerebriforme]